MRRGISNMALGLGLLLVLGRPAARAAGSVQLKWTAPGDDGRVGTAAAYELRYSLLPLTAGNFANALLVSGVPAPRSGGTPESLRVGGMPDIVPLYFAVRARDEAFNWSAISNVAVYRPRVLGTVPLADEIAFGPAVPNPARSAASFEVACTEVAYVRASVYDLSGRLVRRLADGPYEPGRWTLRWDLHDQGGRPVESGAYLVRATISGRPYVRRAIVIR